MQIMEKFTMKTKFVRVSPVTHKKLKACAVEHELTFGKFLTKLIDQEIERMRKQNGNNTERIGN